MKHIIGIIFMALGALFIFFFKGYDGNFIPYPLLWLVASIILFALGLLLYIFSKPKALKELEKSYHSEFKRLVEHGEQITVDLKQCKIVSSNYTEELPRSSSERIQWLDSLSSNNTLTEQVEFNQTQVIYTLDDLTGTRVFISPVIEKDKATLSFLLDLQRETTIYVDVQNPEIYYFDLSFLLE